jgi:two-component system OmpR family response regulator
MSIFIVRSSTLVTIAAVRILVVEDEPKMGRLLARGFADEGDVADVAASGEEALRMAVSTRYDAIMLDVILPGLDGFVTCRVLRSRGVWTPVLLTAWDLVSDRERFEAGADDLLVKPFSFAGLLARLHALAQHAPGERPTTQLVDDLRFNPAANRVWHGDLELEL